MKKYCKILGDVILHYKPIRPTHEEIESTLPGFKDQHVPKMMTPEIIEDVIPFVKEFRSKQKIVWKKRNQ